MSAGYTEYMIQLYNERTGLAIDDDSGVVNVLTANSPAEATIYSNDAGTSASNPLTFTNGVARFWTASSVTSVDLSILTADGQAVFVEGLTPSQHRIDINTERSEYKLIIPFTYSGASETVVDTGFDWGASMLMKDAVLHVTTLGTGMALSVGTSTDPSGFAVAVTCAATGFYPLSETVVSGATAGAVGLYLVSATSGAVRKKALRSNSTSGANIVYQNTTSSSTAGAGYIYLVYERIPTL